MTLTQDARLPAAPSPSSSGADAGLAADTGVTVPTPRPVPLQRPAPVALVLRFPPDYYVG